MCTSHVITRATRYPVFNAVHAVFICDKRVGCVLSAGTVHLCACCAERTKCDADVLAHIVICSWLNNERYDWCRRV